jgi:Domain of unknown function (DUF5666)
MRTIDRKTKAAAQFHESFARALLFSFCIALGLSWVALRSHAQTQQPGSSTVAKAIGAVKAISGSTITLAPDSGPEVNISVQPETQILRVVPGEKTLSNAASIPVTDLLVGDRIRVTGKMSDDNQALVAAKIIAIKQSDIEARHQQDIQDWQKRGVDGVATGVDASAGTVTITVRNKSIAIHASPTTVIRRYPADSVKFDDAKPSTLQEIHPGDQVRARGDRNADGTALTADELVSGSFRNIAGTVNSIDASSSTMNVHDLLSKKNVVIKVTPDSQLRHLPPEMAQRIAARLKGAGAGTAASSGSAPNGQTPRAPRAQGAPDGTGSGSGGGPGGRSGSSPDFQQLLSRIPAASLSDLHKGDAVVLVSTEGDGSAVTAITLLSGVEPILQAAPGAGSSSILSPWSLSAPAGDAGGP